MNELKRSIRKSALMGFSALFFFACGSSGGDNSSEQGEQGKAPTKGGQRMQEGGSARKGGQRGQGGRPGGASMKQLDVSDKELKTFYELSQEVMPIQREFQKDQQQKVKESEMSMKRYRQILMAQRQKKDPGMSKKEKGQIQEIQKEQRKMLQKMRKKVRKIVESKEGMDWKRFNTIAKGINKDPKLKKRFEKLRKKGAADSAAAR